MTEQRLTDEQIAEISYSCMHPAGPRVDNFKFARAIEAAILSADRGEPVAWRRRIRYSWGECWDYRDNEMNPFTDPVALGASVVIDPHPLYAAAPSTPQPDTVQVPKKVDHGHGHVWPRADGGRARCGGPAVCKLCALDHAAKTIAQKESKE